MQRPQRGTIQAGEGHQASPGEPTEGDGETPLAEPQAAAAGDPGAPILRALAEAMIADGLSVAPSATAQAAARQRLDRLKADPAWFAKVMAGDADATAEYERLNRASLSG